MRFVMSLALAAICAVAPGASAQRPAATSPAPPASGAPAQTAVALPPAPTAPVGSGDSASRVARSRLYLARGDAALAAGMRDTARVAWETALYENPALTDASVELATMLVENGDGWFGRKVIERALHFDPRNPKLLHFSAHRRPSPADSAGR